MFKWQANQLKLLSKKLFVNKQTNYISISYKVNQLVSLLHNILQIDISFSAAWKETQTN